MPAATPGEAQPSHLPPALLLPLAALAQAPVLTGTVPVANAGAARKTGLGKRQPKRWQVAAGPLPPGRAELGGLGAAAREAVVDRIPG